MPTGRFVLRASVPRHDTNWQHEWTESQKGEFATMATAIADSFEESAPVLVKQVHEADERERERHRQFEIQERRRRARQRAEERQRARQAAKEELRSIVKAWNDAFALEAFFSELSRRAAMLDGDDRAELEGRIAAARDLMGGRDAVERFLQWTLPAAEEPDGADDDIDDDHDSRN